MSASVAGTVPLTSPVAGTPTLSDSAIASTHTLPPWPVSRGRVREDEARRRRRRVTLIVTGGNELCGARMSLRVQLRVVVPVQVQPVPPMLVTVRPVGTRSEIVVVLPSVGSSETFDAVSVIVPVPPRLSCVCAVASLSGCGTSTHGDGGVPG